MPNAPETDEGSLAREKLGWKALVLILAFHTAGAAIATYPMIAVFRSALPEAFDSLQHLWVMRWYKTCLLEGHWPLHCPQIQHPVGASLGSFSPLHIQAVLYFPLSLIIENDILCYNIIWMLGLVLTGTGTSLLIWEVLGNRLCAAFGGLLAMLSGPMMIHAHGHLELIYVGAFPLFLVAWMRFVDRPSWGKLAASVFAYILVVMSAAYFMVFAVFPAVLYVAWRGAGAGIRGVWPWLRSRAPWLFGFALASLPFLCVLFSGHLLAIVRGHEMTRSREEFNLYGAPLWTYVSPTIAHRLGAVRSFDLYKVFGGKTGEGTSYLGMVTIALLAYAACHRLGLKRAKYLWSTLALLVILSLGASATIAGRTLSLPSAWLWDYFPVYRLTRVPARFNLFAGVLAGTLAAAGLGHLLARFPRRWMKGAMFSGLTVLAVADLATVPFWIVPPPTMPACYAFLKERDPDATILEIPYLGSGGSQLNAACTYWQSLHRLTTSAGYSGHVNAMQDNAIGHNSPFSAGRLAEPDYLEDPSKSIFSVNTRVDLKDYLWLYLTVHRFDYIILHQWEGSVPEHPVRLDRVKALLQECKVYEDEAAVVYARTRLRPPQRPVFLNVGEWHARSPWDGQWNSVVPKSARVAVYNPDAAKDLRLALDAAALRRKRAITLTAGTRELAHWELAPGEYHHCTSPAFRLPAGLQELIITSEGRNPYAQGAASQEEKPYSLRIARVSLDTIPEETPIAIQDDGELRSQPRRGVRK